MIELSGKYAVTLYELLESAANKSVPELTATVEELRHWLKVPAGKLLQWQDFRRKALEPAVQQINILIVRNWQISPKILKLFEMRHENASSSSLSNRDSDSGGA